MKKIIKEKELQEKMKEAIAILCDPVKKTLGPVGNNAIIDHSTFSPFITNDGVTIAKNIESDDTVINTILELAKEASIKTDETVGDGTTTTLVLLESIFLDGLETIKNGKKAIHLKNELNEALLKLIPLIRKKSRKPYKKDFLHIACISANDFEIGKTISDTFLKVKDKNAIRLVDNDKNETHTIYYEGYCFPTNIASLYFLTTNAIFLEDCYTLLINNVIDNLEEIALLLNPILEKNKNLIIVANDYGDTFINAILSLYLEEHKNIILFKNPEYGENQLTFLQDLSFLGNCQIIHNFENINANFLGKLQMVEIAKEETRIHFSKTPEIKKYKKRIEKDLVQYTSLVDKEYHKKRIAMFSHGLAEIKIGGNTETEIREKHMRFQDAALALEASKNGILPGCGVTFLEIKEEFSANTDGEKILRNALEKPFIQILENAGIEQTKIKEEIKKNNFKKIFNVSKNAYENELDTSVLDPTEVVINSLVNACSIASLLLTTSNLIINEYQNNLNKQNEYNEI